MTRLTTANIMHPRRTRPLWRKRLLSVAVAGALLWGLGALPATTQPAYALAHIEQGALDDSDHINFMTQDRIRYRWIASLMRMTQQYTSNMMHQMLIVGTFFDAKHQLETQRLMQQMVARAHRDYHPGDQMCRFGTTVRSLAALDERARVNAQAVSTILMNRELLAGETSAAGGATSDRKARLRQFKTTYCNINDNNGQLAALCRLTARQDGEDFTRGAPDARSNRDIDFVRSIDGRYTLDIDFTDTELTPDEEDVLALARNLFAHDIFERMPRAQLGQTVNHDDYLDTRSLTAIRGLARNSFGHIVGLRARGGNNITTPFIHTVIRELGVPAAEINEFLGENPSYFAQMEVLTRKMYQNPSFYANLYDKPANVARAGASMQAIKLMQDRDRFEAALRREMLLSALLEMKLREAEGQAVGNLTSYQRFEASPPAAVP